MANPIVWFGWPSFVGYDRSLKGGVSPVVVVAVEIGGRADD
jgi:hypothetical protein